MKARSSTHDGIRAVVIVAIMLAVPFSCVLARLALHWLEHRAASQDEHALGGMLLPA